MRYRNVLVFSWKVQCPVSRLLGFGFFSRRVELTGDTEHVLGTVMSADNFVITAGGRMSQ